MIYLYLILIPILAFAGAWFWKKINLDIETVLFFARPGEGKTSVVATIILSLLNDYPKLEEKIPNDRYRILMCDLKLNTKIENEELKHYLGEEQKNGVKNLIMDYTKQIPDEILANGNIRRRHLFYWEKPPQLRYCPRIKCWRGETRHILHDADIIIDEIQNFCPADGWKDLGRWLRKFFAQYRHQGNRIYATTQDYKAVDINFRRMVKHPYRVSAYFKNRDVAESMPKIKWVHGIILHYWFNPDELEDNGGASTSQKIKESIPVNFTIINKSLVSTFDTTQDLPEYMPDKLEHLEMQCVKINCTHRDRIRITHRPI